MNSVKFGNKKALQINNQVTKQDIFNRIENKWQIDIDYKRYHFLDGNRAKELKQKEHSFVLNTYGAKYLIYLTKQSGKDYLLFICRKTKNIYMVKSRFSDELFNETLLEGELLKIDNYWYFYLSDALVYKNNKVINESFQNRYEILQNLMTNEYKADKYLDCFSLLLKDRFSYAELKSCKEKYISTLPFKVNGMLFKSHSLSTYDILYIFPECRNKKQSSNSDSSSIDDEQKNDQPEENKKKAPSPKPTKQQQNPVENSDNIYVVQKTDFPDVYEIYDSADDTKKVKIGYASVPTLGISDLIRNWFADEEIKKVKAKCEKDPKNGKWIPSELVSFIK